MESTLLDQVSQLLHGKVARQLRVARVEAVVVLIHRQQPNYLASNNEGSGLWRDAVYRSSHSGSV